MYSCAIASDSRLRNIRGARVRRRAPIALAAFALFAATAAAATPEEIAATVCMPCHGERGANSIPTFPQLAGQQPDYVAKQLGDFATGRRASDTMKPVLAQITRGDFAGLAAYFGAQSPARSTANDAALAAEGRKLFENGDLAAGIPPCASCHQPGAAGSGRYPRLASQHPLYTLQQLLDFKAGARHNDRHHLMRDIAARLSETQMKALAEYVAGL